MEFTHSFIVKSSLEKVHQFHLNPQALRMLTPFPIRVDLKNIPTQITNDTTIEFTLWFLFIPIIWKANILNISNNGFTDMLVSGPFKNWRHIHYYFQLDSDHTLITDTIFANIKMNIITGLIGLMMFFSLPILFLYRKHKTRKLLMD